MSTMRHTLWTLCSLILLLGSRAHADVALLLEEPYGGFGQINPTGHAAIYLPRVCATASTVLRRCAPGETGVVISRYYKIADYDWIAIPLVAYLYAVDDAADIPESVDAKFANRLRDRYRRAHLEMLAPDGPNGETPGGLWTEMVGEAYLRKIYGFQIETSEQQDDNFIRVFNERRNHGGRRDLITFLLSRNCADFARGVLNFYFPHSIHRNFIADAGITTPKQVAKSLVKYAHRNRDLQFWGFVIPQVPGSIHRSQPVDGVAESLVRSKKYVVPLAILHPGFIGVVAVLYLGEGRFSPSRQVARLPESPEIAALQEVKQKNLPATAEADSLKLKQAAAQPAE